MALGAHGRRDRSGPAGLAAAQQLTRAGHTVAVYERADKIGGLLRYGIPEFKMEKKHLDRRLDQMKREGTVFRAGVDVGAELTAEAARSATTPWCWRWAPPGARPAGARPRARRHPPGDGVPAAVEPVRARGATARRREQILATDKNVVIIGGGDTGADCLGTSTRHGARSITQLEIMPEPPAVASGRTALADVPHDVPGLLGPRGGAANRVFAVSTKEFLGDDDGNVRALRVVDVVFEDGKLTEVEGTEREIPAELVLFAMGFVGPEKPGLVEQLGVDLDARGNVARDKAYMTSVTVSSPPATSAAVSR